MLSSLTYFQDDWAGDHNFKVGADFFREIRRGHAGGLSRNPGGRNLIPEQYLHMDLFHLLQNGVPAEVYLFEAPNFNDSRLWTYSAYGSDSWAMNQHLTLNLGARYDRYRHYLPENSHGVGRIHCFSVECQAGGITYPGATLLTWNQVAPRFGATFDVAGDGKTVIKTNYAWYYWNPSADLADSVNPNNQEWFQRHEWADLNGNGNWDPGEEGALNARRGGAASTSLDPNVDDQRTRELAFWLERELIPNFGIRGGYVYRKIDNLYQNGVGTRPFSAYNVPVEIQDPGPDGSTGTADDGPILNGFNLDPAVLALGIVNQTRNVPGEPEFHTFEISGTKRMADNWSLIGGFSYRLTRDMDNNYFGNTIRGGEGGLENPNECINTGDSDCRFHFTTWNFKVNATYQAPGQWIISPNLRHQAGQPFGRIFRPRLNYGRQRILAEPMDTNRQDNITVFDVRTEKAFDIGPQRGGRLIGFFDVYNITNSNAAENINANSGGSYLRPIEILNPRIMRIGVKFEW